MKAVTIARFGGPDVLELSEVDKPVPQPGEALVELECAGVNFIDIYMRAGQYARSHTYRTPLPMTLNLPPRTMPDGSSDNLKTFPSMTSV